MSYVSPKLRSEFESLSIELKNKILEKNVSIDSIETLQELVEKTKNETL